MRGHHETRLHPGDVFLLIRLEPPQLDKARRDRAHVNLGQIRQPIDRRAEIAMERAQDPDPPRTGLHLGLEPRLPRPFVRGLECHVPVKACEHLFAHRLSFLRWGAPEWARTGFRQQVMSRLKRLHSQERQVSVWI
ncbi:MAG: hypothetical protein EA407_04110 [Rhodobacteraceae bacterium]|nr:MAG: hypothetical protein EA407_04110 [Paracoccaceae bacterium]